METNHERAFAERPDVYAAWAAERVDLSDVEIMDVVRAAAVRCFFSKTLDALGIRPDALYRELDPAMQEALVVGRPIADA